MVPEYYVSYRISVSKLRVSEVVGLFEDSNAVLAFEVSGKGVEHYHAVVADANQECIKKRIQAMKLGPAMYWSKKNYKNNFCKAVGYTIKAGDLQFFGDFDKYMETVRMYTDVRESLEVVHADKDTDRDWQLTFANLVRVCQNWQREKKLKTDDLGVVLQHFTTHSRWIPSTTMLRYGIDPYYFQLFKARLNGESAPPFWERRPINVGYHMPPHADSI